MQSRCSTLLGILKRPTYGALALGLATSLFSLVMWLPNLSIILTLWYSSTATGVDILAMLWALYGSLATDYTFLTASYVVLLSFLFGIHIAVLAFYIRHMRAATAGLARAETVSFMGMVAAAFGIGCAACGSLVLFSLLSAVGAGGVLALLPLAGAEFGFLGVGLLGYATYVLLGKMQFTRTC